MKNHLQQLAKQSYNGNQLDQEKVETIANNLDRHSLKEYIRLLKQEEAKHEVLITSVVALSDKELEKIQTLFPGKKLIPTVDSSMISGVKIVDKDQEYEINLNRTFHDIIRFLSTNDR